MSQELVDARIRFFIGDVRDKDRLLRAMNGVDVVIHAAAMKQVPACEYNPLEAVKTNVLGAANIIDAAIDNAVPRVLFMCTDKAVSRPTPMRAGGPVSRAFVTATSSAAAVA
jgi:UDP-N-acetylglucosamine 4,6-dehydratase